MGCRSCEREGERVDMITEKIASYEQLLEEVRKGHQLVVLEDTVIDINKFKSLHPGGSEVLLDNIGTEVSRFFYGGFRHRLREVHAHSEGAIQMLKNISVGTINNVLKHKIFRPLKLQHDDQLEKESWKLVSKKMVSSGHAVFQFRSPNYKLAGMLPYFDHCGKYYSLHSSHLKMSRNLACLFTPSESLLTHYLELLNAFQKETSYVTPFPDICNVQKDYLELYVKRVGEFSSFLHEFPFGEEDVKGVNNDFRVRGPFGPGLMIEPDQRGTIVGITCGTGVVLFLDLAMYLLRKLIYKIGRSRKRNYVMFGKENFDRLNDKSFKLILLSAFREKSEVLGEPLFKALHEISAKFLFNVFEYHLRVSEFGDTRWDERFFKEHIPLDARKIIVYGPFGAEESIRRILTNAGFQHSQFHRI